METRRVAAIMAGGSGERFWPLSSPARPKQLLRLTHPHMTMLEDAVRRIRQVFGPERIYLCTSWNLKLVITEENLVPAGNVLAEPCRRNTLGALVWLAASLANLGHGNDTVAVLTSDHWIGNLDLFRRDISSALDAAEAEQGLVTIGIPPTRPETGYGYLEADLASKHPGRAVFSLRSFREKPSLETAESFVSRPNFYWNSGMLFFTLESFRDALRSCQPEAFNAYLRIIEALRDGNQIEAVRVFESIPNISFDYAVMERADRVSMLPARFEWDDIGSWDALSRSLKADILGNIVQGRVVVLESSGCIVVNDVADAVVGVLGLADQIVVNTAEGVLVCPKDLAQRVRDVCAATEESLATRINLA